MLRLFAVLRLDMMARCFEMAVQSFSQFVRNDGTLDPGAWAMAVYMECFITS